MIHDVLIASSKSMQEVQDAFHQQFGSNREGLFTGSSWGYTLFAFFLALVIAGLWYYDRFYLRRKKRGLIDNPGSLFRDLCKAHQLDMHKRSILKRIAQERELEDPLAIFIEPTHLSLACRQAETQEKKALLKAMYDQLFGKEQDHSGEDDSPNDDGPDRGGGKGPASPPFSPAANTFDRYEDFDIGVRTEEDTPDFAEPESFTAKQTSEARNSSFISQRRKEKKQFVSGIHLEYPHLEKIPVDPLISTVSDLTTQMASCVLRNRLLHGEGLQATPSFIESLTSENDPETSSEDQKKPVRESTGKATPPFLTEVGKKPRDSKTKHSGKATTHNLNWFEKKNSSPFIAASEKASGRQSASREKKTSRNVVTGFGGKASRDHESSESRAGVDFFEGLGHSK